MSAVAAFAVALGVAAPAQADCTCRSQDGSRYQLGQSICIRVGAKPYLARCEMNLNVSTWRKLQDGCPQAGKTVARSPVLR